MSSLIIVQDTSNSENLETVHSQPDFTKFPPLLIAGENEVMLKQLEVKAFSTDISR